MTPVNGIHTVNNACLFGRSKTDSVKDNKASVGNVWSGYATNTINSAGAPQVGPSKDVAANTKPAYVLGNGTNPNSAVNEKEMANVMDLKNTYSAIPAEKRTDKQNEFLKDYDAALGNTKEMNELVKNYASMA